MFVTEIYIHPLFDPSSVAHDLAIIETQDEIPFSSKVGPACMPFKHINNDFVGDIVKVLGEFALPFFARATCRNVFISSGWGTVNFADSTSGSLQKSYLKVAPMAQCTETYRNETERNQLCTYIAKVNSCQVDLGGPILWSDPTTGRLNVIGVVSDRFVCAESTPSMHTRLATVNNMNWLKVVLTGKSRVSLKPGTSIIDKNQSFYFFRSTLLRLIHLYCILVYVRSISGDYFMLIYI